MSDENTYILTTDGDVKFTHESVEALMDLMTRDRTCTVGAVCARTHPLGIGPIVWYQTFDYAIGHWFQKVLHVCTCITVWEYLPVLFPDQKDCIFLVKVAFYCTQ